MYAIYAYLIIISTLFCAFESVVILIHCKNQCAATLRRARRALTDYAAPPLVPGGSRGKMIVLVSDGCLDDLRAVEQEGIQGALDRVYVLSVAISKAYLPILTRISVQVIEQRTPIDWGNTVACPGW